MKTEAKALACKLVRDPVCANDPTIAKGVRWLGVRGGDHVVEDGEGLRWSVDLVTGNVVRGPANDVPVDPWD